VDAGDLLATPLVEVSADVDVDVSVGARALNRKYGWLHLMKTRPD
jgi:hypothetical protein